jgi:hypothetical protein
MPLADAKWRSSWTAADHAALKAALARQFGAMQAPGAKRWFKTVDRDHVYSVVAGDNSPFESLLIGGYLLSMQLDRPWWSSGAQILYEQFLLKVDPAASNIRPVIKALVHLGKVTGAAGVAVGTALNPSDRKLARVYERFGFQTTAHSLYLETS